MFRASTKFRLGWHKVDTHGTTLKGSRPKAKPMDHLLFGLGILLIATACSMTIAEAHRASAPRRRVYRGASFVFGFGLLLALSDGPLLPEQLRETSLRQDSMPARRKPRHDQHLSERDIQNPHARFRRGYSADADRQHVRHEFQELAGARLDLWLTAQREPALTASSGLARARHGSRWPGDDRVQSRIA